MFEFNKKKIKYFVILSFLCYCQSLDLVTRIKDDQRVVGHLPRDVYPTLYNLTFLINHSNLTYSVDETIVLVVIKPTTSISLHARKLNVNWNEINLQHGKRKIALKEFKIYDQTEIVELIFYEQLSQSEYTLDINLSGKISKNSKNGFYVSPEREIITTQFYPNYAHTVFPCFDEDDFKSKFAINVYHHTNYSALSNMLLSEWAGPIPEYNNFSLTTFPESIIMAPSSLALSITTNAPYSMNDQRVRIFAPVVKLDSECEWAFEYGVIALRQLELWIGRSYPLPKIDFISVLDLPKTNINTYGSIRIKAPILFYNKQKPMDTYIDRRQISADLIVNGITSGWFGDEKLNSWLNEAFATYFQYKITSQIQADWRYMDQFIVRETQKSMSNETLLANVNNEKLKVSKAVSIIRMLEVILGSEAFRKSIRNFIDMGSVNSVNLDQLFNVVQNQVNEAQIHLPATVKETFKNFFNADDYPQINVIHQYHNASESSETQITYLGDSNYFIPLTFSYANHLNFDKVTPESWLFPNSTLNIKKKSVKKDEWIIVNNQATGYYRVNYDVDNWNLLIKTLNSTNFTDIHVLNRAQLIDDAVHFAKNGILEFDTIFDLISYLKQETDLIPWQAAKNSIDFLDRMLRGREEHQHIEVLVRTLTADIYPNFSITNLGELDHLKRLQRMIIAKFACESGNKNCIKEAEQLIDKIVNNTDYVTPELHAIVFCALSKHTSKWDNKFQSSVRKYIMSKLMDKTQQYDDEVERAASGLGCTEDEDLIRQLLDVTTMVIPPIFNFQIKQSYRDVVFKTMAVGSYTGTKMALEFLKKNFVSMKNRFKSISAVFDAIGPYITTEELLNLLNDLIDTHKTKFNDEISNAANEALNRGKININWISIHQSSITQWLHSNVVVDDAENNAKKTNLNIILLVLLPLSSIWFLSFV